MKQSKRASLAESVSSTALGFVVSMGILEGVNQVWDLSLGLGDNVAITTLFTVASVLRSYGVRRFFNWLQHRAKPERGSAEPSSEEKWQQYIAGQTNAGADQYVRVPDGMSIGEALLILTPTGPLFNNPSDVEDVLNERDVVRPIQT